MAEREAKFVVNAALAGNLLIAAAKCVVSFFHRQLAGPAAQPAAGGRV